MSAIGYLESVDSIGNKPSKGTIDQGKEDQGNQCIRKCFKAGLGQKILITFMKH